jgi:pteridine reductase
MNTAQVALITGAGRRLGAAITEALHDAGYHVVLHCRQSVDDAEALTEGLNAKRQDTARLIQGDLRDIAALSELVARAASFWGELDVLINNASAFYPTPFQSATAAMWEDMLGTNLRAPFFLAQAAAPYLARTGGTIVNLCDIHAEHTLEGFSIYSISKAGLVAMTKSLAKELAPRVRVNGVAPGAILWPEAAANPEEERQVLARVPLARTGCPSDIANAVAFLVDRAPYVTGQILAVDGGRSLFN